jgi:hypothetical protein
MNSAEPKLGITKVQIAAMQRTLKTLERQNAAIGGSADGDMVRRGIEQRIYEIQTLLKRGD